MEYPEEIYWDNFVPGISLTRQKTFLVERAYDMGKADAKNLDGYSNLTEAISAGEHIDWERLDGLEVQCVHTDMGTLRGKMDRDARYYTNKPRGWWISGGDNSYINAFCFAWHGENGWTLWIEGEVPLRRKTADQLEVGTYFLSKFEGGRERLAYVGVRGGSNGKIIYYAPEMIKLDTPPYKWVVIEEYGPFKKPEGK